MGWLEKWRERLEEEEDLAMLVRTIAATPWFHRPLPGEARWQVVVTELFVLVDHQDRVRFFFYQTPGAWLELRLRPGLHAVTGRAQLSEPKRRREDTLQDGTGEEVGVRWLAMLLQKQLQEALPALTVSLPVREGTDVWYFTVLTAGEKGPVGIEKTGP